jgi:hypothetical protein
VAKFNRDSRVSRPERTGGGGGEGAFGWKYIHKYTCVFFSDIPVSQDTYTRPTMRERGGGDHGHSDNQSLTPLIPIGKGSNRLTVTGKNVCQLMLWTRIDSDIGDLHSWRFSLLLDSEKGEPYL